MPTFTPSSAQRRLLDYIHENPSPLPTLGLCKSANVSRASYYRWCRDPNFRAWLGIAWSSRLLIDGISLMNQARAQAPSKFPYWRALADLTFDPKGLGTIAKWGESLVHLSPDAFLSGPDVKPRPNPKTPAGPRPQPLWVAELYKDSEFPPPAPPEISPSGFPIYHPESVEDWNRRHGFVDEPGPKGPQPGGAEPRSKRTAERSAVVRSRSNRLNPVSTIHLLQRALNPSYPLRRRRRSPLVAQPGLKGPRLSGPDPHTEWAAWRSHAGRPQSLSASPVAQPGRRGPRLSGPDVHIERAARRSRVGGAGASGACSRSINETVKAVPKQQTNPGRSLPSPASSTACTQQPRAFSPLHPHRRLHSCSCRALSHPNCPPTRSRTTSRGRYRPQRPVPGSSVHSQ